MNAIKLHSNKKQPLCLNVCVAYQGCVIQLSHFVIKLFNLVIYLTHVLQKCENYRGITPCVQHTSSHRTHVHTKCYAAASPH